MDWIFELACTGTAKARRDVETWLDAAHAGWRDLPGLAALDLYRADRGRRARPVQQ